MPSRPGTQHHICWLTTATLLLAACASAPPVLPPATRHADPLPKPAGSSSPIDVDAGQESTEPSTCSLPLPPNKIAAASGLLSTFTNERPTWSPLRQHLLFFTTRYGAAAPTWLPLSRRFFPPPRWQIVPPHVRQAVFVQQGANLLLVHDTANLSLVNFPVPTVSTGITNSFSSIKHVFVPARASDTAWIEGVDPYGHSTLFALRFNPKPAIRKSVQLPTGSNVLDIDPWGRRVVVRVPEAQHGLCLMTLPSGQRSCFPQNEHVQAARFSDNGQSVIAALRVPVHGSKLVKWTVTGTQVTKVADVPRDGQVAQLQVSRAGHSIVALISGDRSQHVVVWSGATGKLTCQAPLPPGSGAIGPISGNSRSLPLSWETPQAPRDLFSLDTTRCHIRPLRHDERPRLAWLNNISFRIDQLSDTPDDLWLEMMSPRPDANKSSHDSGPPRTFPSNPSSPMTDGGMPGSSIAAPRFVVLFDQLLAGPARPLRWSPLRRWLASQGFTVLQPRQGGHGSRQTPLADVIASVNGWLGAHGAPNRSTTWLLTPRTVSAARLVGELPVTGRVILWQGHQTTERLPPTQHASSERERNASTSTTPGPRHPNAAILFPGCHRRPVALTQAARALRHSFGPRLDRWAPGCGDTTLARTFVAISVLSRPVPCARSSSTNK